MAANPGFFSRLKRGWNAFWVNEPVTWPADPVAEVTEPKLVEYEPPSGSEVLTIAARGEVFELQLNPYFQWSSETMSLDTLAERAQRYVEPARGRLLREIWQTARAFGPADAAGAEQAINALAPLREGWCYDDEEGVIRCRPTVRVTLDPRLREHTLPFELDRLKLDAQHRFALVHAGYVQERSQRWMEVIKRLEAIAELGELERQFLAPFAAMLTDKDFALVMTELANVRRARATDLVSVLQQASRNHESVGLFEFAQAYDKAMTAYSRQLGLDPYRWALDDVNPASAS